MATGRHAKGKGKHRADTPNPWFKWLLFVLVIVGLGSALPLLAGLGIALGILFGWLSKATTRT